jgi:hypothetical protein
MFLAVRLPKTLIKMAWTIMPTSFLGSTFEIAYNDNTKDKQAKEKKEGVGNDGNQAQHMT